MANDQQRAVIALLREAGAAHGVYETTELGGVYDQQWAAWYAAYLLKHGLGELLGQALWAETLAKQLSNYDQSYQHEGPAQDWPEYYASRLMDQASA